tara:strand:- start:44 stop:148 length:105 start_codon:yes stop_codon:yes gene_type:complete
MVVRLHDLKKPDLLLLGPVVKIYGVPLIVLISKS